MVDTICMTRSAGKSKLAADDLVLKLEEGNNRWPKTSLQVFHRLWNEQGALVCAQQEVQGTLSISQACPNDRH